MSSCLVELHESQKWKKQTQSQTQKQTYRRVCVYERKCIHAAFSAARNVVFTARADDACRATLAFYLTPAFVARRGRCIYTWMIGFGDSAVGCGGSTGVLSSQRNASLKARPPSLRGDAASSELALGPLSSDTVMSLGEVVRLVLHTGEVVVPQATEMEEQAG